MMFIRGAEQPLLCPLFFFILRVYNTVANMISIARREKTFLAFFIACVLAIVFLPHMIAYGISTPAHQYTGILHDYQDANAYLSWIKQAVDGKTLFHLAYTSEPNPSIFFHPLFLAIGLIVRYTHLPVMAVWYGVQALADIVLLISVYVFIAYFFDDVFRRRLAFILATLGSGLGWFFVSVQSGNGQNTFLPVDLSLPEATVFQILRWPFLFALATSLMLWIFLFILEVLKKGGWHTARYAGLLGFILNFIHPYDIITVFAVILGFVMVNKATRHWRQLFLFFFLSSLPFLIHFMVYLDPAFRLHNQFPMLSPSLLEYLAGVGIILPFVLAGITLVLRNLRSSPYAFLIVWVVCTYILVYLPFTFQRRLIMGVSIPLAVLGVVGLNQIWHKLSGNDLKNIVRAPRIILIVAFFFLTLTNIMFLRGDVTYISARADPFFLSQDTLDALNWLGGHTQREDIVLSSWETGSFIPRIAGNTAFIGHFAQTLNVEDKDRQVRWFYGADFDTDEKREFLIQNKIKYVFIGPSEERLNGGHFPEQPFLKQVYRNDDVRIFQVW